MQQCIHVFTRFKLLTFFSFWKDRSNVNGSHGILHLARNTLGNIGFCCTVFLLSLRIEINIMLSLMIERRFGAPTYLRHKKTTHDRTL